MLGRKRQVFGGQSCFLSPLAQSGVACAARICVSQGRGFTGTRPDKSRRRGSVRSLNVTGAVRSVSPAARERKAPERWLDLVGGNIAAVILIAG